MNDLNTKLESINARIALACAKAGRRADEISILAVSKAQPAGRIRQLFAAGQTAFGENYLQEALAKQAQLADLDLQWHFIGLIQANKTGEIARHFHWVQSADRAKILQRLSRQRPVELPQLNICLQVNIDHEPQKAGALPEQIPQLAELVDSLPQLQLRGLMAIPKPASQKSGSPPAFQRMHDLFCRLRANDPAIDTLSIGMSADFEQAIQAGGTMVRIGTDLFGPRRQDAGK
jgi:hypothetical protein